MKSALNFIDPVIDYQIKKSDFILKRFTLTKFTISERMKNSINGMVTSICPIRERWVTDSIFYGLLKNIKGQGLHKK